MSDRLSHEQKRQKEKEQLLEKREILKARQGKIDARLRQLEQPTKQERAKDTKRKVIAGAVILKMIQTDKDLYERFQPVLMASLAHESDRKLFDEFFTNFKRETDKVD